MSYQIRLNSVYIALFSPGIVIPDKLKVASSINTALSNLFDGDPLILPLPEDIPSDFPRIELNSKDLRYKLRIAGNNFSFIFKNPQEEEKEDLLPDEDLFKKFTTVFCYFKNELNTQFVRCGVVVDWMIKLEKQRCLEFLLEKYIKDKVPVEKPLETILRFRMRDKILEFDTNKWIEIRSVPERSVSEQKELFVFKIDINTLAERVYKFEEETVRSFLKSSVDVMKKELEKHKSLWEI